MGVADQGLWIHWSAAHEALCDAAMVADVAQIDVKVGGRVAAGTSLVLLESMKMEIPVLTEIGGTVRDVAVREGDVVQEGDVLAVVEQLG